MDKIKIGKLGEKYVLQFLVSQNYEHLNQNYYSRFGEIDLIVLDLSERELVFVEVKARAQNHFGTPEEAITFQKKSKILRTALHYLQNQKKHIAFSWRIDLIAVKLSKHGKLEKINHLKNIFDG